MVKVTVSGTNLETKKTLDYFNHLEAVGEILVHKIKTISAKNKDTVHYLYIQVNSEANDILKIITN